MRTSAVRYTTSRIVAIVGFLSAVHSANGQGDGWPHVRGPNYDGHSTETEIAESWPEEGPPVLWVRDLGQGYSAFVANGKYLYTQAQDLTGQFVYCLDAATGDTIWTYRYEWPYEAAGVYPGPRSTPTLYADHVYYTSPDGRLGCLRQSDGDHIWSINLETTYGLRGCGFGYSCSPTVIDNLVILPVGGRDAGVVAFDSSTGAEVWKSTDEPASYTPAYPVEFGGQKLVICYMQNALIILDRVTGQIQCRIRLSTGYDEHSCWPVFANSKLWLSGPFQAGSYALDVSELGQSETSLPTVWRTDKLSNDICSSILIEGHLYGFDLLEAQAKTHRPSRGIFRCVEFRSGEVKWSNGSGRPRRSTNTDEFLQDIGQCGMICADHKLIIINELGELILLRPNPQECVELARCTVLGGGLVWTPPCLHNRCVFLRNQSQAMCVYLGESDQLESSDYISPADLHVSDYRNIASAVLAVEPRYMFDVPHDRWLQTWFFTGLVLVIGIKLAAHVFIRRISSGHWIPAADLIGLFLAGAAGTTVVGHATGEFVFTWFLCLFAAIEYVAVESVRTYDDSRLRRLRQRLPLLFLLLISFLYFFACRRLSLVFEWAFFIGYVGALPALWIARTSIQPDRHVLLRVTISVVAYCQFYGATVAFLKLRYQSQ